MATPRRLDKTRQFIAILRKNFILQTRGRKSLLGIGGWAGLILQVLLPVSFFFVMYLPKHYIKPTHHGETYGGAAIRLESRAWSDPYDGSATQPAHGGRAHLILAPDTADVRGLALVLARTLACPRNPVFRTCPVPNLPSSFHCLFMPPVPPPLLSTAVSAAAAAANATVRRASDGDDEAAGAGAGAPEVSYYGSGTGADRLLQRSWWRRRWQQQLGLGEGRGLLAGLKGTGRLAEAAGEGDGVLMNADVATSASNAAAAVGGVAAVAAAGPCSDFATCVTTPDCYSHVLRNQISFAASEKAARRAVTAAPDQVDAIVYFPQATSPAGEAKEDDDDGVDGAHTGADAAATAAAAAAAGETSQVGSGADRGDGGVGGRHGSAAAAAPAAAVTEAAALLGRVVLGMNHTDVPPTKLLLDLFEVAPARGNGLMLYKRYWFFSNLQLAINRAVLGIHVAANAPPPARQPPLPPPAEGPLPPPHTPPQEPTPGPAPSPPTGESPTEGVRDYGRGVSLSGRRSDEETFGGGGGGDVDADEGGHRSPYSVGSPYDTALPVNVEVSYKTFPWPAVTEDLGAASAAVFFNLLLVYAFLPPTRAVVGDIVREKELRLREGMRVLGLSEPSYWMSWGLTHWLLLALSGALCTAAGTYPFANTSPWIMLAFFWLYGAALVSYSYCLSTLFSSSRVAGTATQLLYALSMLPGFVLPAVYEYGSWTWFAACLSPPSAASLYALALVNWEKVAEGITLRTLWTPITQANSFSAATVLWMLAFDITLFGMLTWYLDKVLPKSYGQRLPWWFMFDRRYWSSGGSTGGGGEGDTKRWWHMGHRRTSGRTGTDGAGNGASDTSPLLPFAPGGGSAAGRRSDGGGDTDGDGDTGAVAGAPAVEVHGLVKVFRTLTGESKVAVDHLDMKIERGRITALLGHNGAGKTTTIHILTGMLQPTSGFATVNGFDVGTQMGQVRASLGICPQFDILWPDLTVYEHLELYGAIKGYQREELKDLAVAAATRVGLTPKLHSAAGELSGGQRRKLSVAIAFMGDPAVVFLDEPTSGMDPYSRRFTWDVIRSHRSGSAIVLTTHSMEEADLLGDRVIILARGRVAAEGTGLELKAAHGVGYSLTLVMEQEEAEAAGDGSADGAALLRSGTEEGPSAAAVTAATQSSPIDYVSPTAVAAAAVMEVVQQYVPSAELLSAAGAEVVVRLPREAAASFPALLRDLDGPVGRRRLGVVSYGLSLTTLEEVFLAITAAADQQAEASGAASAAIAAAAAMTAAAPAQGGGGGDAASTTPTPTAAPDPDYATESTSASAPTTPPAARTTNSTRAQRRMFPSALLPPQLTGWRLYGQQMRALLSKRALCARRDRLAVVTQLLVPLALVYVALWICGLQVREPMEPALELSRAKALMSRPLVVSAAPGARNATEGCGGGGSGGGGDSSCLAIFLAGHPAGTGATIDSGTTTIFPGDRGGLSSTLEAFLLRRWYGNKPVYDALHVTGLPPPQALAVSGPSAAAASAPALSIVLLTNQTAVSALPAALSNAMTAVLSYVHAGLPLRPASSAGAVSAAVQPTATAAADVLYGSSDGAARRRQLHGEAPADAANDGESSLGSFSAVSWPLPILATEPLVMVQRDAASLMLVLCLALASSVLSASFVVFLVREQDSNSKHLQLISGAPATAYWLANYCWDLLSYSLSAAGLLVLIASYKLPQYRGQRLAASAGLLWGFGPAGISLTYLLHFLFRDEMRALQRLNTAYFLTGYLGFVITWICDLIQMFVPDAVPLRHWSSFAKWLLRTASPHYCFARGMYDVQSTYNSGFPFAKRARPFDWDVFGSPMVHMAVQTVVYGSLAILYDTGLLTVAYARCQDATAAALRSVRGHEGRRRRRRGEDTNGTAGAQLLALEEGWPSETLFGEPRQRSDVSDAGGGGDDEDDDVDVASERRAVQAGSRNSCQVLLEGVRKSYRQGLFRPAVVAVRGLWVGVPAGECFGLLGVNGAGKTTTFRILTGEVLPDEGDARLGGLSIRTQLAAARRQLGYCPQFEALPGAMTGREVTSMYARLRGVPEPYLAPLVTDLLRRLGLEGAAGSSCGGYSGGMKRKLGVALALVGDPRVTALDEPSTGMDPGARRGLWGCLQSEVIQAGRTVILTSHSMEECEALCTRLTIMAAGRLRCLGTVQHLKGRFGGGYLLEIKTLPRSVSSASLAHITTTATVGTSATTPAPLRATVAAPGTRAAEASETAARLSAWVCSVCPGARLAQVDQNHYTFSIPRASGSDLAGLFEQVESQRAALGVVDYCITQTTLEQVFVAMAAAAAAEEEPRAAADRRPGGGAGQQHGRVSSMV